MKFDLRTIQTVLGYSLTLVEKFTAISFKGTGISSVFNYLQINPNLATSGQPTKKQLIAIQRAGYKKIINLAPSNAENALSNEADIVTALSMDYINIPVDFSNPTEQDFAQFVSQMQKHSTQKIWVHCAANMRVSAFIFRYRTTILKEEHLCAEADLKKIWQPSSVWKRFINL
jgi:protein tyrosine phosphatase (PTP) superfamily phosphohydrolase (DUF442 family)